MTRLQTRTNPFYVLLIVIGIAFTITASAYFVMTLRGSGALGTKLPQATAAGRDEDSPVVAFLDRYGVKLLTAELVLLALATCGAIGTDGWWTPVPPAQGKAAAQSENNSADKRHDQP